jgi:AcrR family transcriptional regulator
MSEARLGRPTREASAGLAGRILDAATVRFLHDGYAATSMEAVAASAGVSKRTLYKRYPEKAALLREAITRMIERFLPGFEQALAGLPSHPPGWRGDARDDVAELEGALVAAASSIHAATLSPEALALYRLLVAESGRFPEIAQAVNDADITIGIARVAALLRRYTAIDDPLWAAEQFQRLVLSGPQWRALGFGEPLDAAALESWARRSVAFFLRAIGLIGANSAGLQAKHPADQPARGQHGERMEFRERQHH